MKTKEKAIGHWDGEPVDYEIVEVLIEKVEEPITHWQNMHVGKIRQCVKLTRDKYVWFIDNEDGTGLSFITKTHGMWNSGTHRSVNLDKTKEYPIVSIEKWNSFNPELYEKTEENYDNWIKTEYPDLHKKMTYLREMVQKSKIK